MIGGVAPIHGTLYKYILVDPVTRPMVKNPRLRWIMYMDGGGEGGRRKSGKMIFERVNLCEADRYFRNLDLGLEDVRYRLVED